MPASSARSCGGRRPSSTWPAVTPPRAPASVWDHRWRSRWHFAASARWWLGRPGWRQDLHDAVAMARNSDPATFAAVVAWTYGFAMHVTGCFGPMTPRCARSRRRCRPPRVQQRFALCVAEYALGVALLNRDAAADRRRGLELMVQARDTWLRERTALPGPGRRVVGRPGEGQARRPRCCDCGDAPSRGRTAPGRTALLWRLGHRRSGGDAAGAWRRGRPGRSPRGDRPVGQPVS